MANLENILVIAKWKIADNIEAITYEWTYTYIKYKNKLKALRYLKYNVKTYKDPKIYLNTDEYCKKNIFYNNGNLLSNYDKILDFWDWYKRFFWENGDFKTYKYVEIKNNPLEIESVNKIISYYKNLIPDINDEEKEIKEFLENQYSKLQHIQPESFLSDYLLKHNNNYLLNIENNYIFPFDFNLSQKIALENTYKSNISIIEWPPWTWKTQTILNIIANLAVMQNKTIAIVSSNNSAINNIEEKLSTKWYGFFVATLWKETNRDKFFDNLPEINKFQVSEKWLDNYNEKLGEILELMKLNDKKVKLDQLLDDYSLEKRHFDIYYEKQDFDKIWKLSFYRNTWENITKFLAENNYINRIWKQDSILYKLKIILKYWFIDFKKLKEQEISVLLYFQKKYYENTILELEKEISNLNKQLENRAFEDLLKKYKDYSKQIFETRLNEKFNKNIKFTKSNYKKNFEEFLDRFPVILSTTHSIINSIKPWYLLDYLIIDEASQVDLLTACLAFSCAKNVIIVWDNNQLPHILDNKKLHDNTDIDEAYNYKNNIISSIELIYWNKIPKKRLVEHYRCNPKIINFCNQKYYNNELIIHTKYDSENEKSLKIIRTSEWNHIRNVTWEWLEKWRYNQREIEEIWTALENIHNNWSIEFKNIWLITPYRKQVNKAIEIIWENISINTIHKYQWREKDIIFLSTVLSDNKNGNIWIKFVDDSRLINVAVSRAKKQFILVTDKHLFSNKWKDLKDLVWYIEYNILDNEIIQWKIVWIFDLLYKDFSKSLEKFNKKLEKYEKNPEKKSEYKTENIINILLKTEILNLNKYNNLDFSQQYRLKNLLNYSDDFTEDELKFIKTVSSLDFIIFSKFNKKPILAVEIDWFNYHENDLEHQKKDRLKDSILVKSWIKILRLPTNWSNEKQKIINTLDEILKDY